MSIIENYGALIETGEVDGFTYEVRSPAYPMVYVYREENGKFIAKQTQKSGSSVMDVVRMLIAELPKAAA
jgi:hypothetical protein